MSDDGPWTIKRLLDWTTSYLQQRGSDSARLDAEVLLAESRGCERIDLYAAFDEVPESEVLGRFREWVKQRAAGTPVAYLVGQREFYSLSFAVNPAVLIPRPETEFVVVEALDRVRQMNPNNDRPLQIADVGTGSGCLAITLAKHLPKARVWAIDISTDALAVARQNAEALEVADRVEFVAGDVLTEFGDQQFDMVVSNPPYVGRSEQNTLDEQVACHEPDLALFAGDDGLSVIKPLVSQAADRLKPGGWLIFEMSPFISQACQELVQASLAFTEVSVRKDLARHDRVLIARRTPQGP